MTQKECDRPELEISEIKVGERFRKDPGDMPPTDLEAEPEARDLAQVGEAVQG